MSDILEEATREMTRARDTATRTAEDLLDRSRAARDRGDYSAYDRLSLTAKDARDAEVRATKKLIAGLVNPDGTKVRSLVDATRELDDRLERLRHSESALNQVAAAITLLTHAIMLF